MGAWPGLGAQPHYEAPGDLKVEIVKTQWLTSSYWWCPLGNGLKLAMGHPNSSKKSENQEYGFVKVAISCD